MKRDLDLPSRRYEVWWSDRGGELFSERFFYLRDAVHKAKTLIFGVSERRLPRELYIVDHGHSGTLNAQVLAWDGPSGWGHRKLTELVRKFCPSPGKPKPNHGQQKGCGL